MEAWFRYNWMVREQWYEWCGELTEEELLRERTGGIGSILRTLFHIVDVEWSWMRNFVRRSRRLFTPGMIVWRPVSSAIPSPMAV
ncbi:hypothetical protein PUR_33940 [Paenibacillus sp. URB8-2]|nr:hypothetical protein PUR_33940 [Paenibacillus sp. URB8-2]